MKENYTAKLIIRGLPKMDELELRDLIIWLEEQIKNFRDEYNKPIPSKTYANIYTTRLMKKDYGFIPKSPHNPEYETN